MGKTRRKIKEDEPSEDNKKSEPQFPKRSSSEKKPLNKFHIPSERFGRPFNVDK